MRHAVQDSHRKIAVADFLGRFDHATIALLLLDYDGTLAPFQTDRHRAFPYSGVIPVLDRIIRSGRTKVSIISGRPVSEIENLLNPLTDFEIWGAHGLEHRSADGAYQRAKINFDISAILQEAEDWLREAGLLSIAEIKPGGIAVHWRGMSSSEMQRVQNAVGEGWRKFDEAHQIKLLAFDGGIELRAAHPDKGDAIHAILANADPAAPIAFLGDDLTDEDAFRVLNGYGLSVLVRSEYRDTAANAWLRPPQELIDFLELWSKTLSTD